MVRWAHSVRRPIIVGAVVFGVVQPLLLLLHELVIVAAAGPLRLIATFPPLREMLAATPLDPIYTAAALEMVGKIKVAGVAVAAPLGDLLHAALPALFAPARPGGAWIEAAIWSDSTLVARGLATFASDVAMLAMGILMVRTGVREEPDPPTAPSVGRRTWLGVCGVLVQAQVALRLASNPPSPGDLEAVGLSFALGVLFPTLTGRRVAISDLQNVVPGPLLVVLLVVLALGAAYVAALLLVRVATAANLLLAALPGWVPPVRTQPSHCQRQSSGAVAAMLAMLITAGLIATQSTTQLEVPLNTGDENSVTARPAESGSLLNIAEVGALQSPTAASVVAVVGLDYNFAYVVNGEPQVIRGMGYNPMYAAFDQAERGRRYDRDFFQMRQAGVNTVFGWVNTEFDKLTLDKAQEQGLGVAMPYHLSPAQDYANLEVQAALRRDVLAWVESYKSHPALRMWSIGNEVLHKIVNPSWLPLKKNSPQAIAQAKAFARFYVELITLIHSADAGHPVLLRDAEDAYLSWIREALQADAVQRPWFIYGVNVYTSRLKDVVDNWPKHKMNVPLLISEFAPGGLGPKFRPEGYRTMWHAIRRHPEWTLGGVPYVWTTAGPEEVDRAFGLVDANGKPVDGSLDSIGSMFTAADRPTQTRGNLTP